MRKGIMGLCLFGMTLLSSCNSEKMDVTIYETSANGNALTEIVPGEMSGDIDVSISINPSIKKQTITGFGGSFTEASASLLNRLSPENRTKIIEAYFGESGARYSLTRTHMNSCDFSLINYSYAPVEGDKELEHFSIKEDMDDLIQMIKAAQAASKDGFKIIASPWTAPPWMKDNKDWRGGKLLKEYYPTWALFFSKYTEAYKDQGIDIWSFTVENEPLGNDNNWESMHFTPEEMTDFVVNHLGPQLEREKQDVKILGYDQNRGHELKEWVDNMYATEASRKYYDGTAVHWYASTYDWFPKALQYAHSLAPDKYLIQTEGCVDSEVPKWKDDAWYWSKEATDWGWDWAPADQKYLHPKYAPVNRYARDLIGCLNNWVDGWVDWNMVLDRKGGPNWFKNWCVAPIIVDPEADEVYFTPLYHVMSHFSRYIRPGARILETQVNDDKVMATSAVNPDGSTVCVVFNPEIETRNIQVTINDKVVNYPLGGQSLQTILLPQ